jgi:hypothetical protein
MLEQGLFNSVPIDIAREMSIDPREYREWVRQSRLLNSSFFDGAVTDRGWKTFRDSVHHSFRGFCRKLVFQPSILREYELARQRNRQILSEALIEVRLSDQSLRELKLTTREEIANAS